jgi:RNA polymerase sigma factor (sigma-70 family)
MDEHDWLVKRFEAERPQLQAMAYRMLGSLPEAQDAVQESWLRLVRTDPSTVSNPGAWLSRAVTRICLDMLRARKSRGEESLEASFAGSITRVPGRSDPEEEAELVDAVGLALLVVLDQLTPAERLAYVLHDIFAVPFDEIAPLVERSEAAARQLASRARRRVRGRAHMQDADLTASREVVEAFLTAARTGNFDALLAVLDPDVVLRRDPLTVPAGVAGELHGAAAVAKQFVGRAQATQTALVNGSVGVVVAPYGRLIGVFDVSIRGGKIIAITTITDPARLRQLHLAVLDD